MLCLRLRSERADACLAAIAGAYASADMAGGGARCAACRGAGDAATTGKESLVAGRPWVACEQRLAAYDDGLFANGKEYGRCGGRVSRRGLQDSGDRSGRHGGLRLADVQGDHVCAVEVSRAGSGIQLDDLCKSGPYPKSPMALEDAQRTVGLVRFHAAEWHIDPHKIGVLGFSAGGHLVAAMSTHFDKRLYPAVDAADKESCRPDFAVALYPGHLSLADEQEIRVESRISIVTDHPPDAADVFAAGRG